MMRMTDGTIPFSRSNQYASYYPIRDLKNTSEISQMCLDSKEAIFTTKNGYGDMVIMSMDSYEEKLFILDAYEKTAAAKVQVNEDKTLEAIDSLKS